MYPLDDGNATIPDLFVFLDPVAKDNKEGVVGCPKGNWPHQCIIGAAASAILAAIAVMRSNAAQGGPFAQTPPEVMSRFLSILPIVLDPFQLALPS